MIENNNIVEMENEEDNMIEFNNIPILSKYLKGSTYLDILIKLVYYLHNQSYYLLRYPFQQYYFQSFFI